MTLDRMMAERVKGTPPYRWLRGTPPPPPFAGDEPALDGLGLEQIDWYHTIDLGDGVVTPGFVDHRDQVRLYGLPDSLAGMRCLDVATFDGFWAFEMEKRGAAEVVGIDVYSLADCDFPTNWRREYLGAQKLTVKGSGFAYAKRARNSTAQRRVLSVYELSPRTVGTFDFVFMSDLMLHLREPLRALEAVWSVARGEVIVADAYDKELEASGVTGAMRFMVGLDEFSGCLWWNFTSSSLEALMRVARFQDVRKIAQFDLATRLGGVVPKVVFAARGGR
jgi:tRNA (mo5U34)-methyltransferase